MRDFLEQIHVALAHDLHYLALFTSLAIPDICGAIESNSGTASSRKYIHWFNEYVSDKYLPFLTGEDCYYFRCSALHQGSSQHPKSSYSRVVFLEPSATTNVFHRNILNDALNLDVRLFCLDMLDGAKKWLQEHEGTELYEKNYSKFLKRYPNGLAPYIVGTPVIS